MKPIIIQIVTYCCQTYNTKIYTTNRYLYQLLRYQLSIFHACPNTLHTKFCSIDIPKCLPLKYYLSFWQKLTVSRCRIIVSKIIFDRLPDGGVQGVCLQVFQRDTDPIAFDLGLLTIGGLVSEHRHDHLLEICIYLLFVVDVIKLFQKKSGKSRFSPKLKQQEWAILKLMNILEYSFALKQNCFQILVHGQTSKQTFFNFLILGKSRFLPNKVL